MAGVGVGVVGAAYIRTEYLDIDCCPLCHRANPDLWPGIVPQENLIEYKFVLRLILSSPRSSFLFLIIRTEYNSIGGGLNGAGHTGFRLRFIVLIKSAILSTILCVEM